MSTIVIKEVVKMATVSPSGKDKRTALKTEYPIEENAKDEFNKWAVSANIDKWVYVCSYYVQDHYGIAWFPAIMVKEGAPESVITACLLKWQ